MKLFYKGKDGGQYSTVTGYWLVEIKKAFSLAVLCFQGKSREAFHTHAFNSISWVLKGQLTENFLDGTSKVYKGSLLPIMTYRDTLHKVDSEGDTWVLTFRGPWVDKWKEIRPDGKYSLSNGRIETKCT